MTATLHTPARPRSSASERSSRLQTVRRLYFYLVALIASTAGLVAVSGLLTSLADTLLPGNAVLMLGRDNYMRRSIALSAGLLVVTTPLFLIHWRAIGASLDQPGERRAGMRKFMLYIVSAIALGNLAGASGRLIEGLARLALGDGLQNSPIWPSAWAYNLGISIVAGLLLFYWQWALRQDGDFGAERGTALIWRRLFLAGVTLVGLALLIFGSATLFSALLQRLLEAGAPTIRSSWFAVNMASGIAQILVGAVMARTTWQVWEAIMTRAPGEQLSAVRRLFLYVAVIGGALATLVPAALGLRRLLLWAFAGFDAPWMDVALQLVNPVGFIPAGVLIWRAFAAILHRLETIEEEDSAAETPDAATATVRRIYHYAVAATGLVLLWIGAGNVLQVILDRLITAPDVVGGSIWQGPLATGLSLVAVGAPVWAVHWRTVQRVARESTDAGVAERASLPRRIYLYGVSLAGALVILFFLAQVLYRLLLVAMGDRSTSFFSAELAEEVARSVVAALLWGVHLAALRADTRQMGEAAAAHAPSAAQERTRVEARIAELEAELAELRQTLAAFAQEPGNR